MASEAAAVDWTALPAHLLSLILERLLVPDFIRCRTVCRSWLLAAATEAPNGPTKPEPPYLLMAGDEADENSEFRTLYSLSERWTYRLHLPQVRGHRFLGSGDGWLVTMDEFAELHLFNPLTGTQIALPSITTFSGIEGTVRDDGDGRITGYMYRPLLELFFRDLEHMLERFFRRAMIFSSSSSSNKNKIVVFIIYGDCFDLAFVRAGDKQWTELEKPPFHCQVTDVTHHKGLFYASLHNGFTIVGDWIAYDIDSCEPPKMIYIAPPYKDKKGMKHYLTELHSELLMVWKHEVESPDTDNDLRMVVTTRAFTVLGLDFKRNEMVVINSLGEGVALFVGDNRAMTLSTREFPELKENCIYFTNGDGRIGKWFRHTRRDAGIFHMKDKTIEPLFPERSPLNRLTWPPPLWFTPRLF